MARENNRPQKRQEEKDGLIKKTICVNRVTKVVKGGRKMRFAALVVVGDGAGRVGCGMGKANEVPEALEKATTQAKKNMKAVSLVGNTIPHELVAKYGRGSVIMLPAGRYRRYRRRSGSCGNGMRRHHQYQNQISRNEQPHQYG